MEKTSGNKRESGMSRIIGVEESVEQEILDYFKRKFEKKQVGPFEQEHTQEMDALISGINEKMKEFMAKYGAQPLDIPVQNIHVVDKSEMSSEQVENLKKRYEKVSGIYRPLDQCIVVLETYTLNQKLRFTSILVHEMIHMYGFTSTEKINEGGLKLLKDEHEINLGIRRVGFSIESKNGQRFFIDTNEAITEELNIRFDNSYFSQFEDLKPEFEERKEAIKAFAKKDGKPEEYFKSAISSTTHRQGKDNHEKGSHEVVIHSYAYSTQREKLNELIKDLYEKNKNDFQSAEDVFTMFAKAAITGRLLPIAKLVEKTYGKGSFRELDKQSTKKTTEAN